MKDEIDTEMAGRIKETVPEISDLDSQNECSANSYEAMEDKSDTEMLGDIKKPTPKI